MIKRPAFLAFIASLVLASVSACSSATQGALADRPEPLAGGETSDFGEGDQGVCANDSVEPATRAELEALGIDVEGDLALFAGERTVPFLWGHDEDGADETRSTELELEVELDSTFLIERRATQPDDTGATCPAVPQYRVHVGMRTLDGRLSGSFFARLDRSMFGGPELGAAPLIARPTPDLLSFTGRLTLGIDVERTHWSVLEVGLIFGADRVYGTVQPIVVYRDDREPSQLVAVPHGAWASDSDFSDVPRAIGPDEEGVALDDYLGSPMPARFDVKVRAQSLQPTGPVDVRVVVDGREQVHEGATGTAIAIGSFEAGAHIEAEVSNASGAGQVRVDVLVDNCFRAHARCLNPDCTARATYTIWPSVCYE